jgi:2-oxoglutarate dehydrogenase E2 component (dihydrolipoamide succinyltransferase)
VRNWVKKTNFAARIMAEKSILMPKMGESIAEATIIRWLKKEGDPIAQDEPIVEIATDKVDSEIPSTEAGIIGKILHPEGAVVKVGEPVAMIITEGTAAAAPSTPVAEPTPVQQLQNNVAQAREAAAPVAAGSRFYSPLVLNIARTEGIGMDELERIPGTGKEDRVTKADILNYVKNRSNAPAAVAASAATPAAPVAEAPAAPRAEVKSSPAIAVNAGDEIIEMDRVRKMIAENMVRSKQISPHVTSFVEADVTNLVQWREKNKGIFQKREGESLTFTPIFIECIVRAIKDFPMINISVDGDKIIRRRNINIGMAAAQPNGNLIVPVIKNADMMNLTGLARSVNDLAKRARENKLTLDEIQGGTYTLTNVGTFGNVMGTPIIPQPQVAIMAAGAIRKKPAVVETQYGDVIAIRHMMFLSHSYDHRVVDGALGGQFVRRVADYMEQWDPNREV